MNAHIPQDLADAWTETPVTRVESFAARLAMLARDEKRRVTHPGEGADMNAALVASTRQATLLEVHLDLNYLTHELRKMAENDARDRHDALVAAERKGHRDGLEEGVAKGMAHEKRNAQEEAQRSNHANANAIREMCAVLVPQGHVAAWMHIHEEPDGTKFQREVYGRVDADVREGDQRAVIASGPDKYLVGLDRLRFAETMHDLVASAELDRLEAGEVLEGTGTVRFRDGMDGGGYLDMFVDVLPEGEEEEGSKPGTYLRLNAVRSGNGRVLLDFTKDQWREIVYAADVLYARHLIREAEAQA